MHFALEDLTIIAFNQAVSDSTVVEISEDGMHLRPIDRPERWPVVGNAPSSFSSLKVDVPEFVPGKKISGWCFYFASFQTLVFIIFLF